jgi:hypothetical protein
MLAHALHQQTPQDFAGRAFWDLVNELHAPDFFVGSHTLSDKVDNLVR